MNYKTLGRTGLTVSALGFGGIPIQRIDAEGTKKLMYQLMDAGVNFVDSRVLPTSCVSTRSTSSLM